MEATYKGSKVTITYEPHNFDRLYSPDGRLHLIPCSAGCGRVEWVAPLVESVMCETCANNRDNGEDN